MGCDCCFRSRGGVDVFASYRLFKGEDEDSSEDNDSDR